MPAGLRGSPEGRHAAATTALSQRGARKNRHGRSRAVRGDLAGGMSRPRLRAGWQRGSGLQVERCPLRPGRPLLRPCLLAAPSSATRSNGSPRRRRSAKETAAQRRGLSVERGDRYADSGSGFENPRVAAGARILGPRIPHPRNNKARQCVGGLLSGIWCPGKDSPILSISY